MSLALELLETRKQAGLFGSSTFGGGPTNFGLMEGKARPTLLPSLGGVTLPARMAPEATPPHIQEAKNRSLANTAQIQNVMKAVGSRGAAPVPAPELSPAERDARHTTTLNTLKAVEASRTAPKMPLPPGPKVACTNHPALDVMRLRAS